LQSRSTSGVLGVPSGFSRPLACATFSGRADSTRFSGTLKAGVPKPSRLSPPGADTSVCSTPKFE
jgi:hypothetical protein